MQKDIDIIILSYAKNEQLKALTEQTLKTLYDSEDPCEIRFNPIVIESNNGLKPFTFERSATIYPETEFGFHKYLNIGIRQTNSEYVCLCNNDLIFHKGWASEIIKAMDADPELLSAGPYCPNSHGPKNISRANRVEYGYVNGIHITGWCLFVKRVLFEKAGYLDENLKYWYCDNDYGNTLSKFGIKHALITRSTVTHISNIKSEILDKKNLFEYTYGQFLYFDYKWNKKSKPLFLLRKSLLPLFRYVYLQRRKSRFHEWLTYEFARIYGGLKHID